MANLCDFEMVVRGNRKDVETFRNALCQIGTTYMGRGADLMSEEYEDCEDGCRAVFRGYTKWSVEASLVRNAVDMRTNPDMWYFGEGINKEELTFVTIWEACKSLNLDVEIYSEEIGIGFEEHYLFKDGELITSDCVDFSVEIDDETGETETVSGGFGEWEFEI